MPTRRFVLPAILTLAALLAPVTARADSGTESQFVAATNSARSQHGLPAYRVAADLTGVARRWAAHMAATRTLAHNPNVASQVCCWRTLGENVGVGSSVAQIQRAFMASAPHRANILSTSYTQVGIGTARGSDGRLYVDEVFRRPTSAAPRAFAPHSTTTTATPLRRASRSATRPALPPRGHPALAHPRGVVRRGPLLSVVFLRQVRAGLPATSRADPVAGAFGYLQVMGRVARAGTPRR